MANVFNAEVVCTVSEEGAAVGAAIQAIWAYHKQQGQPTNIADLCDRYLALDESTRAKPQEENVALYAKMQPLHDRLAQDLSNYFAEHRKLLSA